ncbi:MULTISPECIES: hypothetical protein [Bacillus]|uniref:General stress protein n=2 Tax=Bacillus thuringiensis TaxID=1428 RepID=A0AAP4V2K8_BACTU|nr:MULTISPECIES: hypothetical protein [Bacillus]MEC0046179.1 general stress protein [Bacillus cereus]AFV21537.1 hypothetical protein BTB_502p02320 [Bacillus thuringiensis Bt407]EEM25428.1 hypothetical protein bthur0002_60700 [Bacillus thuringiensis Bt407]ERI01287.1 hypothetical protein BTCBT_002842 [Bacillus thuringiensis T01-328]MBN6708021.1 general stress protein [Bacillus thuringiensis]
MKENIEKRLSYLFTGELFGLITFIVVSFMIDYSFPTLHLFSLCSFWASFLLLEFILVQGTLYWYVKRKRLRQEKTSITPVWIIYKLKTFKILNGGLLLIGLIMFSVDIFNWYPKLPLRGLSVAGFVYIFALLEHINYYYVQLSYDNIADIRHLLKSKRLKQSCMKKDLKRIS